MKKTLLALTTILAMSLVFVGCDKDPATNNDSGSGSKPGTGSSAPIVEEEDDENIEDEEVVQTIFASGTLVNGGYGTAEIIEEDGVKVAHLVAGSYMKGVYTPTEPLNISGKKVKVTAKVGEDYVQGDGLFKLIFVTDDTHQSEITANDKGNVGWCNLTTEYTSYTGTDIWIAYEIANEADLTNITSIIIHPQSATGDIYVKNIEFVD